jgi:Family of unknown function (DUF6074)
MSAASPRENHYGQSPDVGCKLIPFPQSRRRCFIMETVTRLLGAPAKTAERLLAATLEQQARVMARKGVPPDLSELERRKLECAIRAELWRQVLLPDDAA